MHCLFHWLFFLDDSTAHLALWTVWKWRPTPDHKSHLIIWFCNRLCGNTWRFFYLFLLFIWFFCIVKLLTFHFTPFIINFPIPISFSPDTLIIMRNKNLWHKLYIFGRGWSCRMSLLKLSFHFRNQWFINHILKFMNSCSILRLNFEGSLQHLLTNRIKLIKVNIDSFFVGNAAKETFNLLPLIKTMSS